MPRLSLYRPQKGNDFKFIDKAVWEMFQIGGTDVFVHKYLGPGAAVQGDTPTTPTYNTTDPFQIQDMLFLENRDRKYDSDVYLLRGVYSLTDIDFNLSQFGLFLQNDTIFITFHINDTVEKIGRKLMSGDVIELPHLKDEYAYNDLQYALKRYYVIEEVNRAAEGFSVTWYPHLYRAKCKPLVDSQEFKDILDQVQTDANGDPDPNGTTLRDIMSTYEKEMQITQAVLDQAEADAPKSGYSTVNQYILQKDSNGDVELVTADSSVIDASVQTQATDSGGNPLVDSNGDPIYVGATASTIYQSPAYDGPINGEGDGVPPNGAPFTAGIAFPLQPTEGQYHLRTDYLPRRLFRFNGSRWIKIEDVTRMTMSNNEGYDQSLNRGTWSSATEYAVNDRVQFGGIEYIARSTNTNSSPETNPTVWGEIRMTHKTSFINNNNSNVINGHTVKEKQSLSKALRPEAD
jgi:hypothetical protein